MLWFVNFFAGIFSKVRSSSIREKTGWYEPKDPTSREQCPCCDYFSLAERGKYLICKVCFWEDDGLDVDNLGEISGPNHISLREGRENFQKFGACDKEMIPNVLQISERKKFKYKQRDLI